MAQQKPSAQKKQRSIDDIRKGDAKTSSGIPPKFQTPLAIVSIFVVLLIFFSGVLSKDKAFNAGDNIASQSILPYLNAAQAAGTSVPQWIPNIFCGMPSFASLISTGARTYDIVHEGFDLVRDIPVAVFGGNDAMIHIWHYFIFGLGMYLLLRLGRKTSHLVAFFAAFSAMFSTWIVTYVMIGHNTKVFAVMCFPYILLALEKLREEKVTWQRMVFWCSALAIALHFLLESSHPQMAFYQFLAILIYFIVWLITDLKNKRNVVAVLRTGIISLVMVGLAFAMSADRYLASLGYDSYSIRGASPLVDRLTLGTGVEQKATSSTGVSASGGLDWNYATEYSFSPGEMITFIVPGWYGFGKQSYSGPEVQGEAKVPTYWGQATMTDCANYTGVIVFFLALIGIFSLWKRERLIAPLAIISLFALFLSFGSTFSILFKPMFNYFPAFNKFRAPMMALVLMQMCFPIIAALTLQQIIDSIKNADDKALKARLTKYTTYALYVAAGLFVVFLIGRGIFDGMIRSGIKASGKPLAGYPQSIQDLAVSTALNDAAICTLIAALAIGALWMYLRGKIKNAAIPLGLVIVLTVIDLWRVDYRPLDITNKSDYDAAFNEHDYISFIKQDKSLYRVLDMNEPTSNIPVSWNLQTIAGYHAAKMREYQDVVDVTGDAQGFYIFNPFMWSLLNTKYVIANGAVDSIQGRMTPVFVSKEPAQSREGKKEQTIVWQNNAVLPRAFFVRSYEVHQPLEYLKLMRDGSFSPRDVLFFDKQPEGMPATIDSSIAPNETVEITKYENENVELKTTTNYPRLLFMSDTWYPNWQAELDGKPTTMYKADWAFRAFAVPAGTHTLKLTYHDNKYETGRMISLVTNVIAVLGLVLGIGTTMKKKKEL
ncbi:MAG TPA: YfhO family protein [Candidatus Kapabacteria bacterium]|nr:YfhO family protein [Candidatus Kapabacteria bacterium]